MNSTEKLPPRRCFHNNYWFRRLLAMVWLLAFGVWFVQADLQLIFAADAHPHTLTAEDQASRSYSEAGTPLMLNISSASVANDIPLPLEGSEDVSRALKNAIATQPEGGTTTGIPETSVVAQEIRYELAEAGEVSLGWGINGWHLVPEELRPEGTRINDGTMSTPMAHDGKTFVVTVKVPSGTVIDYGFWISRKRSGQTVGVWDGNGYPPLGYQTIARPNHPILIIATLNLEKALAQGTHTYAQLMTEEIRYHAKTAQEVTLVWGINGWQTVSESIRPAGTVLKDKLMQTPMIQKGDTFTAKVQVPAGAVMEYAFLVTMTNSGSNNRIWDGGENRRQIVTQNDIIDVNASGEAAMQSAATSEPSGIRPVNSSITPGVFWLLVALAVVVICVVILVKLRVIQSILSSFFNGVPGIRR